MKEPVVWGKCKSIYKWLSHHYIQRRSVVFIVDTQFDSVVYRDKAMKYVKDYYTTGLNDEDFFGYISLDESTQSSMDEIILERRAANMKMKSRLLKEVSERQVDYVFSGTGGESSSKTIRLERALEKAYEWQNTLVANTETEVHGKVYVGPHKWIVCLLGDDVYSINQFRLNNRDRLSKQQNVSISIMTLSAEPKNSRYRSKDYRELTELTKEGLFVNIVDKNRCDLVAERFLSSMDVYPSQHRNSMREFFGSL